MSKEAWCGDDDTVWGTKFVYCRSHGRVHSTGWCTVALYNKVPMMGDTIEEAQEEMHWRQHGTDRTPWFWEYHG